MAVSHPWPLDEVLRDYSISADEAAQLRAYFQPSLPRTMRAERPETAQEVPGLSIAPISVAA